MCHELVSYCPIMSVSTNNCDIYNDLNVCITITSKWHRGRYHRYTVCLYDNGSDAPEFLLSICTEKVNLFIQSKNRMSWWFYFLTSKWTWNWCDSAASAKGFILSEFRLLFWYYTHQKWNPRELPQIELCLLLDMYLKLYLHIWIRHYRQTYNIRRNLMGNKIVHHSDVVGAAPTPY